MPDLQVKVEVVVPHDFVPMTISEAQERYPNEWALAKEYYPVATDEQIAEVISIAALTTPIKIKSLEIVDKPYYLKPE